MAEKTLRIHQVLFNSNPESIGRSIRSLSAAARHALANTEIDAISIAVGDCSPTPVFADGEGIFPPGHAFTECRYHFFDANLGSGGGNNALWHLAESTPDLLFIANPDTYSAPTLLTEMAARFAEDQDIGIADARQIPMEHPKAYDPSTGDCSWASGACTMVRGAAFNAVGGYADEFFPLYCDDVDLSWRVQLQGHRCVHIPTAVIHHDKRPSASGAPIASEPERYWAVLAGLLLARRWGRPDLAAELEGIVEQGRDKTQLLALEEFRERERAGTVPSPIEGADTVAQFVRGNYADHRF